MKYMRRTAGYNWTDYKTNTQITKELKITPILDKLLEYKRSWIQHVNRMPRNILPRVTKHYSPTGRRNHGRPLRDFWMHETGTGQQVAQLHDRYMMMMMESRLMFVCLYTSCTYKKQLRTDNSGRLLLHSLIYNIRTLCLISLISSVNFRILKF